MNKFDLFNHVGTIINLLIIVTINFFLFSSDLFGSSNLVYFGDVVKLRISTFNYSNFQILSPLDHDFRGILYHDQVFVLKSQRHIHEHIHEQIHDQYLTLDSNLLKLVDQPTNWTLHHIHDNYKYMDFALNYDDLFWLQIGTRYMSLVGNDLYLFDQPQKAWQIEKL